MKISKDILVNDFTIRKDIFEIYMYIVSMNTDTFSLTKMRKDLGLKEKDIEDKRKNRDYIIKSLYTLKKKEYLDYSYDKDVLKVKIHEKEDVIDVNDIVLNYFKNNYLNNTEKRILMLLLTENTSKNRFMLYKKAFVKDRAGKLNIKSLINKKVFRVSDMKSLTQRIRMIWKNNKHPLDFSEQIINKIK